MQEKIDLIKKRLDEAKIKYEEVTPKHPELPPRLIYEINAEKEVHQCMLRYKDEIIDIAHDSNFEKFRFLKSLEGIWSEEKETIEVEVSNINLQNSRFLDRLAEIVKPSGIEDEEKEQELTNIELPSIGDLKISIGYCSKEFALLTSSRTREIFHRSLRKISIKIRGAKISNHDAAKDLIEKIANSIFFQIDMRFEIPLSLQSQRKSWVERINSSERKKSIIDQHAIISEPKYEYDNEPMSLYWYAKESFSMPIFQYLAYYQSIEFYFSVYSSYEAKQKIQSLIKDPRFDPNRDTDITKIISNIRISNGGKSFGSEREQLKSTIELCISNEEFLDFFKSDQDRFNFYSDNKGKTLSNHKISVKSEKSDFVAQVAARIYELRCRIVHSKASEGDFDVLLPYSSDVMKMNFDIELIEFISRKVLIRSSRPIKI